jgi:hypothetical protein
VLGTPLHKTVAAMAGQIIPDEQHPHRREKAVQLLVGRVAIPILPASSFGNYRRRRRTLCEDGFEFAFEPGMQDGIGAALHRFSSHLSGRRTQQGEQLERLASNVLMGQARWLTLDVPGRARLRDRLLRTTLILAPQLQPKALSELIGALDHRLFLLAQGIEARAHLAILGWLSLNAVRIRRFANFCGLLRHGSISTTHLVLLRYWGIDRPCSMLKSISFTQFLMFPYYSVSFSGLFLILNTWLSLEKSEPACLDSSSVFC